MLHYWGFLVIIYYHTLKYIILLWYPDQCRQFRAYISKNSLLLCGIFFFSLAARVHHLFFFTPAWFSSDLLTEPSSISLLTLVSKQWPNSLHPSSSTWQTQWEVPAPGAPAPDSLGFLILPSLPHNWGSFLQHSSPPVPEKSKYPNKTDKSGKNEQEAPKSMSNCPKFMFTFLSS